jgi:protein phosphatase-4 regulatory subunit 3
MSSCADGQDYIKQLTVVFEQAEDLESLDDLHALCSLMQTIRA